MDKVIRMRDLHFNPDLFLNYMSGTVLDELLCSYKGLPKGVNYMIIGDPGVGKTTIILGLLSNLKSNTPGARVLFISAETNEIDLAIYVQRFPKFQDLDILFIEASFDEDAASHNLDTVRSVLDQGWDIVVIDSFYELKGIIKEEENLTCKKAESMELPRDAGLLSSSFDRFSGKARESMEVKASMAELKLVSEKLEAYLVGSRSAMGIVPYVDELQQYANAGYDCLKEQLKSMKASMSVWELYNGVTDFASNNQTWSEDDNRRGMLQGEDLRFLMWDRDIRNYSDIFA